jgi:hypothetical protein
MSGASGFNRIVWSSGRDGGNWWAAISKNTMLWRWYSVGTSESFGSRFFAASMAHSWAREEHRLDFEGFGKLPVNEVFGSSAVNESFLFGHSA